MKSICLPRPQRFHLKWRVWRWEFVRFWWPPLRCVSTKKTQKCCLTCSTVSPNHTPAPRSSGGPGWTAWHEHTVRMGTFLRYVNLNTCCFAGTGALESFHVHIKFVLASTHCTWIELVKCQSCHLLANFKPHPEAVSIHWIMADHITCISVEISEEMHTMFAFKMVIIMSSVVPSIWLAINLHHQNNVFF